MTIKDQEFGGERPLYASRGLRLENVTIHAGESSLKECRDIEAADCRFEGKYVFWENDGITIGRCHFTEGARSSLWYSRNCTMRDCTVDAPKLFRRMDGVRVERTGFTNGAEFFWDCRNIELSEVQIKDCDYIFMHSSGIRIDGYRQDGNYGFQQASDIEIHNAVLNSKDAFWEARNVCIYDSEINGEYFGWYARNIRLVRCHLTGRQLLCYAENVVLEDCSFGEDADLLFEYSTVSGNIKGDVTSIKNPTSEPPAIEGECGEMIIDSNRKDSASAYGFDEITERRGTNCVKWDECEGEDVLPLWVADMDFKVAPAIAEAVRRRAEHEVYGYVCVPDSYYSSVADWFSRRHGWKMEKDWIIYTTGVVPAISAIIKAMAKPGDDVLILTPVYNCFFSSIRNNGCNTLELPLRCKGDSFDIDFDEFERLAARPSTSIFLLCNPHNPAGRVWTEEELRRMGDICRKHGVFVIADEIHCELVMPGYRYTPYGSLGHEYELGSAVCTSASKAFNIAGLQTANITAADPKVRERINKAININEICDVNPFGIEALQAAYNKSEGWLDSLLEYINANYLHARSFIEERLPRLKVKKLEGTYLMWVDVSAVCSSAETFTRELLESTGVWFNPGTMYGPAGEGYIRVNLACPRTILDKALSRLEKYLLSIFAES